MVLEPPNWANRMPPMMSRMADSIIETRAPFLDTSMPIEGSQQALEQNEHREAKTDQGAVHHDVRLRDHDRDADLARVQGERA